MESNVIQNCGNCENMLRDAGGMSVPKHCYDCFECSTEDDPYPLWKPIKMTSLKENEFDTVDKPKHYMLFESLGIEVRDVIEKLVAKMCPFDDGMFISDYVQLMQYLMRFMDKNGVEDLKKARWYLNKMIDAYENN